MITNRQLFLQAVAQTSPAPLLLEIERAEGVYLHGADGKKYIDLIAGISVSNVGHSHPAVVLAVQQQAQQYMHLMVYGEFVESPQVQYAKALTEVLPATLNNVYFTNSGAEATEGAMKLAKRLTGRTRMVAFKHSYHGSTQGALSIMGDESFKSAFRPLLPDVLLLEYGNEAELEKITCRCAAVFAEPVQAESGVTVPSAAFLKKLRAKCDETGALLVFDEAQTAFGRTGKLFAFEHHGVVPDMLLLAKALGGGMPLGAFISSRERMQALTHQPVLGHITTFGGHPVCCAAGLAAFKVLQQQVNLNEVEDKGLLFEQQLNKAKGIRKITRSGLMIAIHFDTFEHNKRVIDRCIENGVLTDWFLFAPHCLRIAPPLTISTEQIETACSILTDAIHEVA